MDQTTPAVLVTRRMPSSVLAPLEAAFTVDRHDSTEPLSGEELRERVGGKHGLVCMFDDRIDGAVLAAGDRLKVVATVAVGFDNIDVATAAARGIVVTNTPDLVTGATAELTWALILSVTRRLGEGDRTIRGGAWRGWTFEFLLGSELRGKQLGVVGAGRIGRAVAAIAPAFGMRPVFAARPGRAAASWALIWPRSTRKNCWSPGRPVGLPMPAIWPMPYTSVTLFAPTWAGRALMPRLSKRARGS